MWQYVILAPIIITSAWTVNKELRKFFIPSSIIYYSSTVSQKEENILENISVPSLDSKDRFVNFALYPDHIFLLLKTIKLSRIRQKRILKILSSLQNPLHKNNDKRDKVRALDLFLSLIGGGNECEVSLSLQTEIKGLLVGDKLKNQLARRYC